VCVAGLKNNKSTFIQMIGNAKANKHLVVTTRTVGFHPFAADGISSAQPIFPPLVEIKRKLPQDVPYNCGFRGTLRNMNTGSPVCYGSEKACYIRLAVNRTMAAVRRKRSVLPLKLTKGECIFTVAGCAQPVHVKSRNFRLDFWSSLFFVGGWQRAAQPPHASLLATRSWDMRARAFEVGPGLGVRMPGQGGLPLRSTPARRSRRSNLTVIDPDSSGKRRCRGVELGC